MPIMSGHDRRPYLLEDHDPESGPDVESLMRIGASLLSHRHDQERDGYVVVVDYDDSYTATAESSLPMGYKLELAKQNRERRWNSR